MEKDKVNIEVAVNEIWKCRNSYKYGADEFQADSDTYVLIVADPDYLGSDTFVRVQPISFNIDYRCADDYFIETESILGEAFIIESWNEQPVLLGVLEGKIGELSISLPKPKVQNSFTKEQLRFRESEIKRTAYLRQSVLTSMAVNEIYFERKTRIRTIRNLSIAASFIGLGMFVWQPQRLSSEAFADKYYSGYTAEFDFSKSGGVLSRGSYYLLPNYDLQTSKAIQDGIAAYEDGRYKDVVDNLRVIQALEEYYPEVFFIYATSLYNLGYAKEAVIAYEILMPKLNTINFSSDLLFQLSIAYVNTGKNIKARRTLKALESNDSEYLESYPEILKDLRLY